jgi:hypothetical protein
MSMTGPLGGARAGDPGAPTINAVKTLTVVPLSSAGAGDPRASTIKARKHRRQAPWEAVLELKV